MKTFTIAVAVLALIALPANAQIKKGHESDSNEKKPDVKQQKADERAYKAALEKIPDPKEKYDPWGVARPADTAKDAKDTAKKPKQVSQ